MDFISESGWAPLYKLFKSHVNYALMWILRILGLIKFCKGPIKVSYGPLKFGNLNGIWAILRAHHHFGLRLSLPDPTVGFLEKKISCILKSIKLYIFFHKKICVPSTAYPT